MGFGSFLRGIVAQVNPFDHGQTYGSYNPPKKKPQPGEPGYQAPTSSFSQPGSQSQQNSLRTQSPENLFQGLNKNLSLGSSAPSTVPVFKTPSVQAMPTPAPGTVVKPTVKTPEDNVNDGLNAGKSWQQISRETGVPLGQVQAYSQKTRPNYGITPSSPAAYKPPGFWRTLRDTAIGTVANLPEVGLAAGRAATGIVQGALTLPHAVTSIAATGTQKLANNFNNPVTRQINRGFQDVNTGVKTATRYGVNDVFDPLNRGLDTASKMYERNVPMAYNGAKVYRTSQIPINALAALLTLGGSEVAGGAGEAAGEAGNASKIGQLKDFLSGVLNKPLVSNEDNLISRGAQAVQNAARPTVEALNQPIKSVTGLINKFRPDIAAGEVGNLTSDATTRIPVSQGIDVNAPPSEPVNVPVTNASEPSRLIQEIGGDAKTATSNADVAKRIADNRRASAAINNTTVPDRSIDGITPRPPEKPFALNSDNIAKSQNKIIKDYADTLRGLGEGNGTQLVPDGEGGYVRTTNNVRTAENAGKRMSKADWVAEAEQQLRDGKGMSEVQKAFNDAADPEVQAMLAKGAQTNIPDGRPINVQEVKGIHVLDKTDIPQNLPETPGKVRLTEAAAPNEAKSEAVAAQQLAPPVPKDTPQAILENPEQYNKRQVAAAKAVKEQRGFVDTVASSDTPAAETAAALDPQTYDKLANDTSFNNADNFINQDGVNAAHKLVTDETAPFDATKSGVGQRLMEHYANTNETEKLAEVIDSMDRQARVSGQGIQMLSNWDKLSPEAVFKLANNEAEKAGVNLTDDFQKQILDEMKGVRGLPEGSPERAAAMQGVLKDIAEQLPTTKKEWIQNYRYQNMLSSPLSAEKVGTSGAFNTLITHPVDLFSHAAIDTLHKGASIISNTPYDRSVAFSDIPRYYKDVLQGLPDAWQAAVESFKTGNMDKTFEEGKSGASTISQLRQQNVPLALRPFSATHGAIYHFFQSLVSGGEKARLMEHGMAEEEATAKASELADKLTLRSPLGGEDGAPAVKAVDAIGKLVSDVSKKDNALGSTMKWVAPFMKVSTNWAKLAVEHSPLALIDNPASMTAEQIGKAFTGTVATGIGLSYTMRGDVTLGPPTDPKEQALWYASGRKPYSVKIGNKWIDMRYLGPFAITFALPQAVKDATSGVNAPKSALTKVEKAVQNITQDIVASTPLPSVAGFFNFLNGDSSINPDKILADLTSQAIPLDALNRYIASVTDPIYRQSKTFVDRIKSGIPGESKTLPAFTTPEGQPESRNISNDVLPYPVGVDNPSYSGPLQAREDTLSANSIVNQANKNGTGSGQQVGQNVWQLPDGTFSYKIGNEFKSAKTQADAQTAIAKDSFANSDKSYQVIGDTVFRKSKSGTVTATPKLAYDYSVNASTLASQKKTGDVKGWLSTANTQLENIKQQINAPGVDPLDRNTLQNEAQTLVNDIAKYKTYGGFTKGKGGSGGRRSFNPSFGTLKAGIGAPTVKQYATIGSQAGNVPVINTVRPNIVHKITHG